MKRKFYIKNGSYNDIIVVCVGCSYKEVVRYWKKVHNTNEEPPIDKEDFEGSHVGLFDYDADILWLRNWKNNKEWNDTLRHECHDICHFTLGVRRGMTKEPEALAYHQDYLVESIRDR